VVTKLYNTCWLSTMNHGHVSDCQSSLSVMTAVSVLNWPERHKCVVVVRFQYNITSAAAVQASSVLAGSPRCSACRPASSIVQSQWMRALSDKVTSILWLGSSILLHRRRSGPVRSSAAAAAAMLSRMGCSNPSKHSCFNQSAC
jgi:hypothetical protein